MQSLANVCQAFLCTFEYHIIILHAMSKMHEILKEEKITVEPKSSKRLTLSDFSFMKSRELLKNLHTSLRDTVISERRGAE
jgi:hypothetical protein